MMRRRVKLSESESGRECSISSLEIESWHVALKNLTEQKWYIDSISGDKT